MAKDLRIVKRAFNAGEVSPQFKWRNDVEKHAYACERLENFYVSPIGAVSRRCGTRFLGAIGSASDDVRLVPFEYNRDNAYVLAFKPNAVEHETFTCTSSATVFPSVFSVCLTVSGDAPDGDLMFFQKNGLSVKFSREANYRVLAVGLGGNSQTFSVNEGDKVVVVVNGNSATVYRNKEFAATVSGAFGGDSEPAIIKSHRRGDTWGLKVIGFDVSDSDAYYTLADYQDGTNEAMLKKLTPRVSKTCRASNPFGGLATVAGAMDSALAVLLSKFDNPTTVRGEGEDLLVARQYPSGLSWSDDMTIVDAALSWRDDKTAELRSAVAALAAIDPTQLPTTDPDQSGEAWDAYRAAKLRVVDAEFALFGLDQSEAVYIKQMYPTVFDSNGDLLESYNAADYGEYIHTLEARVLGGKTPYAADGSNRYGYHLGYHFVDSTGAYGAAGKHYAICDGDIDPAWISNFLENPMPLTYDFVRVEYNVPVGAKILFDAEGESVGASFGAVSNIRIKAVAADGITLLPLDGTHSQAIKYLVFCVPIANPNGEAHYSGVIATSLYSNLLDRDLVWTGDKVLLMSAYDSDGVALCQNVNTQIPSDALWEFQYKQAGGWMYFAHGSFAPKWFKFDGAGFEIVPAVKFEPSAEEAVEDLRISVGTADNRNGVYYGGDFGTITASRKYFDAGMVGRQLKLEYIDDAERTYHWRTGDIEAKEVKSVSVAGKVSCQFTPLGEIQITPQGGVWDGILILEESTDNGKTWSEIGRSTSIQGGNNDAFSREVYDSNSVVRVRMKEQNTVVITDGEKLSAAKEGCQFNVVSKARCCAWVRILGVLSPTTASVQFVNPCRAYFDSIAVYESAWSAELGYPRAVEIHEERLTFAGTKSKPSTVWLSQTNNWDNFRSVSNLDTDPLSYTLACDDGEPISWLVSREDLMIGLGSAEWSLGSRDAGQSLTSSIVKASEQSSDGVEYTMPAKVGGMVFYLRRGGRELGSISYDFASDSYNSISLTTINPEILGGGIKCVFNRLSPRNDVFALRTDGQLAVFAFDRENNVAAWSRFIFGDGVAAACALSVGKFKSVMLAVKRGGHLCLERLDPNESDGCGWLDCVPLSDSVAVPSGLATSVRYESFMRTTPIFLEGHVKVNLAEFIMLDSYGGRYRLRGFNEAGEEVVREDDWRNLAARGNDVNAYPIPQSYRFTGNCQNGYLEECSIEVKTDEPAPFTLCAIAVKAGGV